METALYTLGALATVAGLIAAFLPSYNHKSAAVWVLFLSLVLYALTFCLYLQNTIWKEAQAAQPNSQKEERPSPSPASSPSPDPTPPPTPSPTASPAPTTPAKPLRRPRPAATHHGGQPRKAAERLTSFLNRLPDDDSIPEYFVTTYHQDLTDIQNETQYDLTRFFIPETELKPKLLAPRQPRMGNRRAVEARYTKERYVDRDVFILAIDRAIHALKNDPAEAKAETPAAPATYEPDEADKRIIRYLYKSGVDHLLKYIAEAAGLDGRETSLRLNRLIEYGYVNPLPKRTGRDALYNPYSLTDKGIQFAIGNNLRDVKAKPKEVESDTYEPDETDTKILVEISKGNSYDSQIANVLNLEVKQLATSLSLLVRHDYITVHQLTNFAPYYRLTQKGHDYLNKPDYRGIPPHPSGFEWLDETSIEALKVIARPDHDPTVEDIADELRIHPVRVESCLHKLERHNFIWRQSFIHKPDEFYLLEPARAYLINNNLLGDEPKKKSTPPGIIFSDKLEETIGLLTAMRDNMTHGRMELSDRDEYHALLDTAQKELGRDLSAYRIPDTAIESIELPMSVSYDPWGYPATDDTPDYDRFIPARAFKVKLDALINLINRQRG